MSKPRIALQLYSVRDDCQREWEKTIEAVAKMGYEGVELAGYYDRSAEEWRKLLDSLGLVVAGAHIPLDSLLGDEFKKTVEFHKILGNKNLIVPWIPPENFSTKEAIRETAKLFSELGEKLKEKGMHTGYHNHSAEFQRIDGEMIWDIFFGATSPDVIMQLDTGNAMHGGASADEVLEFIRKYPGRAITVHLKEYSATNDKAVIGEGDMKWKEFLSLCETVGGTEWYIVEQESYAYPPLKCVELCLKNLKKIMEE
jgi:sugar phosphate isomerase/epimerase